MKIDISQTKPILKRLNEILLRKCGPNVTLDLGKYKSMMKKRKEVALYYEDADVIDIDNHLLLCLNYTNPANHLNWAKRCIASITCKILDDGSIEISSKTEPKFEGRKINLWLRCATVLLAPHIKFSAHLGQAQHITQIISRAINPISMLLMSKYFGATNAKLEEFMELHELDYPTLVLANMQEFYDEQNEILGDTESEQEEYMMNNENFGEPVFLTIDLTDAAIMERTGQLIETIDVRCPDPTPPKIHTVDNITIRRRRKRTTSRVGRSERRNKSGTLRRSAQ